MKTQNLGYPRIGSQRELKKAEEAYWSGKSSLDELLKVGKQIRIHNWKLQQSIGIDLIPSNDFSYYDQILDHSILFGNIPERYKAIEANQNLNAYDLYFAMARGYQKNGLDITAMEMTKWFDTNYHYIVPEFKKGQTFTLNSEKILREYQEAKELEIETKPVLVGPVSYLLLGKEKESGFHRLDLLESLLSKYLDLLKELAKQNVEWIQIDEPFLALDLDTRSKEAFHYAYSEISKVISSTSSKIMLTTYFEGLKENTRLAATLGTAGLHIDLIRSPEQLIEVLDHLDSKLILSLGIVDGRNIWKNDYSNSLIQIGKAVNKIGADRVFISPSCSLLHSPCDLDLETDSVKLTPEIKQWLSFSKQKLEEVATLAGLTSGISNENLPEKWNRNQAIQRSRQDSSLIHDLKVKERLRNISQKDMRRSNPFPSRKEKQKQSLNLPSFPTTTIGSFPQTSDVRSWRAKFKKGEITESEYTSLLKLETEKAVRWQEEVGLDVLVHGEFERNDMVEYFGEQLNGFAFTQNGWVQSYGSRCVKPPIVYGDVSRTGPMTVEWSRYAQSLTPLPVKGMLTGPVTILQWSFVRDDQPRWETCFQIGLAIRDEVVDLEKAGIRIIQIDEPAIREGLPLRKKDEAAYLDWAVKAFLLSASGVQDGTQIHTHMCYSEFNDILSNIADMDADVITIECSRSQMELLEAFGQFKYPNEIGPGVYDIHSPRVPSKIEMVKLLEKAKSVLPEDQIWVNPDCGLKTRGWEETKKALIEMVDAAKELRAVSK
ncbi:5-methyltetrahydropteroyltriglutamate--homocysteine S-methyltransferase [Leptospira selangorensis]|uniref:5-methyltetrahydropteroyltriglutamate-- homocysteine S-methyltransferase n=1 Tax=Leptospira selangorensis TaxID=2484982 RepID=UPI00108461A5|nr:5-methyltetrahydropteroyltriglutamate--homocysteine S-methyltransferase [Leptospira selangorensis]TGK03378.1 5-methyltetrahydropteroyltriglutamate--homocysteine S-methyltransferase [Leptospira selangorensis]